MRTSSEPAVTSPSMSTTVAPPRSRTPIVAVASVIGAPFRARQGARRVGRDPHEVGQPRDLEDLAVVVAEPPGPHLDAVGAGPPGEGGERGGRGGGGGLWGSPP